MNKNLFKKVNKEEAKKYSQRNNGRFANVVIQFGFNQEKTYPYQYDREWDVALNVYQLIKVFLFPTNGLESLDHMEDFLLIFYDDELKRWVNLKTVHYAKLAASEKSNRTQSSNGMTLLLLCKYTEAELEELNCKLFKDKMRDHFMVPEEILREVKKLPRLNGFPFDCQSAQESKPQPNLTAPKITQVNVIGLVNQEDYFRNLPSENVVQNPSVLGQSRFEETKTLQTHRDSRSPVIPNARQNDPNSQRARSVSPAKSSSRGQVNESGHFYNQGDKKVIQDFKNTIFRNKAEFDNTIMQKLKQNHGGTQVFESHFTENYLVLRCKVCKKFQIWFEFDKNKREDERKDSWIKYQRSINQQHLDPSH